MTPPKKNKLKIANITSSERETLESLRDRLLGEIKTSTLRGTPSANVKPGFAIADEEFCDFYDCAPQEIFNPNYFTPHLSNVTNPYLQIKTSTNQTLEVAPGVYMYGYFDQGENSQWFGTLTEIYSNSLFSGIVLSLLQHPDFDIEFCHPGAECFVIPQSPDARVDSFIDWEIPVYRVVEDDGTGILDEDDDETLTMCVDSYALNYLSNMESNTQECNTFVSENYNVEYSGDWLTDDEELISGCCYNLSEITAQIETGDLNQDGIINIIDIVQLVGIILNDDTPIPTYDFYIPPYAGSGQTCPDGEECLPSDYIDPEECEEDECPILGCTDPTACNNNADATVDNGSCVYQYEEAFGDGIGCMSTWLGNLGDLYGQGPWDCGCSCIGNTGAFVDETGYDCASYCGGENQAGAPNFNIQDCNGDCINMNDWILYRDNPLTFTTCDTRFACYNPSTSTALGFDPGTDPNVGGEQINGEYFNFSCGDGRCTDDCGVCNGSNDCTDCNGVLNGNAVYDGYQNQDLPLTPTPDTGGCCLQTSIIGYYVDSDGDGLGDTGNPNNSELPYFLCPNNPNISTHSLVQNNLDTCLNGTIDICGCCSTTLRNVITDTTCTVNGCIGCMNNDACNTNYKVDNNMCDGDACTINCTNCCVYPQDDCHNCSSPFGDGMCSCETGENCGCGILVDDCGVCGGDNLSCAGCDGVPNSGYQICNVNIACNYGDCILDTPTGDGGCIYPPTYYGCDGNCINDSDNDGICDELDIDGCTDASACNYLPTATNDDGSCTYAELYYDCNGDCLSDIDGDGVCDDLETGGCTDIDACNYDSTATDDNASCSYADLNYNCDGNCIHIDGVDCSGECGGESVIDECGECDGSGIADGACDCDGNVDLGCGCGEAGPSGCGCDLSIIDEGCGCGEGPAILSCADNPNGTHICGDNNLCDYSTCTQPADNYDCNGECINFDDCGTCGGDNTSCTGCTYQSADNYDPTATIDDGNCAFELFAEPYETSITGASQIPGGGNAYQYRKFYFDFYYPFGETLLLKDVFDNIYLEDPDVFCAQQGEAWKDCDTSEIAKMNVINGDVIQTKSFDGMTAFITYQDGWMSFSEDPTNPNIGNADGVGCESGPDNMMTYGDCTQITKGFIGTLILNIGNDCVTGNCPDDCSSPNCDCGVREDMIHCGNPMGWLKFKRPV